MSQPKDELKTQLEQAEQAKLTAFVQQPLQRENIEGAYTFTRLHNGLRRTKIYNNVHTTMPISETTIFHPYNPTGPVAKEYGGMPASVLTIQCLDDLKDIVFKCLPLSLQKLYGPGLLDTKKATICIGTQNLPWAAAKDEPLLILMRPHYWVFGSPENDKEMTSYVFNKTVKCQVGVFASFNEKMTCSNVKDALLPYALDVVAHPDQDKPTIIICSPADQEGKGGVLTDIDYEKTECFYSVVVDPEGRSEIKLHIFLNSADQERLAYLSLSAAKTRSLQDIVNAISEWKDSQLNAKGGPVEQLCKLFSMKIGQKAQILDKSQSAEDDELALALVASLSEKKYEEEDKHVDEALKQALAESAALAAQQKALQAQAQKQAKQDYAYALKASQALAQAPDPVVHGFVTQKQVLTKDQELKDDFEVEKKKLSEQVGTLHTLLKQCTQALDAKYTQQMAQAVISLPGLLEDCQNLLEKLENNTQTVASIQKALASFSLPKLDFIRNKVQIWDKKIKEYQDILKNPDNKAFPSAK